jgi:hypothetical protein
MLIPGPRLLLPSLYSINQTTPEKRFMATKLEQEEYLYRRAIDIIESVDSDAEKDELLFQEVWLPLASIYREKVRDEEE